MSQAGSRRAPDPVEDATHVHRLTGDRDLARELVTAGPTPLWDALGDRLEALRGEEQAARQTVNIRTSFFMCFNFLDRFVKLLGIGLIIGGILIAVFTTRSITKPIQQLKKML